MVILLAKGRTDEMKRTEIHGQRQDGDYEIDRVELSQSEGRREG